MGLLDTIFSTVVARDGVEFVTRKILDFSSAFTIADDGDRTLISMPAGVALADHAARSVLGRAGATAGDAADIVAAADDRVLGRSSGVLSFLQVITAMLADNAVTDAKLRAAAALSILGRASNSSGNLADIAAAANDRVLSRSGNALAFTQVTAAMLSGVLNINYVVSSNTSITLDSATYGSTLVPKALVCTSSSPITVTIPAQGTDDLGEGAFIEVIQWGTGQITYAGTGFTPKSEAGKLKSAAQYTSAFLKKLPTSVANNEWHVSGQLVA